MVKVLKSHEWLKHGKGYVEIPRLAEMQNINDELVISYLCNLTNSMYTGV